MNFLKRLKRFVRRTIWKTLERDPLVGFHINESIPLTYLGTDYGGWSIPEGILDEDSVCYCIGAGEDISFEVELAKKFGGEIHVFDPTPRAHKHFKDLVEKTEQGEQMNIDRSEQAYTISSDQLKNISYHPIGVWSESKTMKFYAPDDETHVSHSLKEQAPGKKYFEAECKTLGDIRQELEHTSITLIKMDIEGAEYEVVESMLKDGIKPKVLCIEFDELYEHLRLKAVRKTIKSLINSGYILCNRSKRDITFILR